MTTPPHHDGLAQLEVLLASQRIFAESVVESLRNLRAEVATLHDELAEMRDETLALAKRVGVEPVPPNFTRDPRTRLRWSQRVGAERESERAMREAFPPEPVA